MQQFIFSVLSCLFLFSCSSANADDQLTLFTEHFPPYNFEQDGKIRGINADILNEACVIAKISCHMQSYPWLRAFELVQKNPDSGIFTISQTESRKHLFQWVGPLASSKSFLYRLTSRTDIVIDSFEQAKQYSIAVAHGDVYEDFFLAQGFEYGKNLIQFRSKSEAIPLFLQGKIDLIIGSDIVIPSWLANNHVSADTAVPAFQINTFGNNFVALNLAVPAEFATRLQQAIDQLKQNGQYHKIVESY